MVNCLIVIMLLWSKNTNIKRLKNMCKVRGVFERDNMILMCENNEVGILIGDMAIKEEHLPRFIRSCSNILNEVLKPIYRNLFISIPCC